MVYLNSKKNESKYFNTSEIGFKKKLQSLTRPRFLKGYLIVKENQLLTTNLLKITVEKIKKIFKKESKTNSALIKEVAINFLKSGEKWIKEKEITEQIIILAKRIGLVKSTHKKTNEVLLNEIWNDICSIPAQKDSLNDLSAKNKTEENQKNENKNEANEKEPNPFLQDEKKQESVKNIISSLEIPQITNLKKTASKHIHFWNTAIKVGGVAIGALATLAGGYFLWKSYTSRSEVAPTIKPLLMLIPVKPVVNIKNEIFDSLLNDVHEKINSTKNIEIEEIPPTITRQASILKGFISQNNRWLIGGGIVGGAGTIIGLAKIVLKKSAIRLESHTFSPATDSFKGEPDKTVAVVGDPNNQRKIESSPPIQNQLDNESTGPIQKKISFYKENKMRFRSKSSANFINKRISQIDILNDNKYPVLIRIESSKEKLNKEHEDYKKLTDEKFNSFLKTKKVDRFFFIEEAIKDYVKMDFEFRYKHGTEFIKKIINNMDKSFYEEMRLIIKNIIERRELIGFNCSEIFEEFIIKDKIGTMDFIKNLIDENKLNQELFEIFKYLLEKFPQEAYEIANYCIGKSGSGCLEIVRNGFDLILKKNKTEAYNYFINYINSSKQISESFIKNNLNDAINYALMDKIENINQKNSINEDIIELFKFIEKIVELKKIDKNCVICVFNSLFSKIVSKTFQVIKQIKKLEDKVLNEEYKQKLITCYDFIDQISGQLVEIDVNNKYGLHLTFDFIMKLVQRISVNFKSRIERMIIKHYINKDLEKSNNFEFTFGFMKKWFNEKNEKMDAENIFFLYETFGEMNIEILKFFNKSFSEKINETIEEVNKKQINSEASKLNGMIKLTIFQKIESDKTSGNENFDLTFAYMKWLADKRNIINQDLVKYAKARINKPEIVKKIEELFKDEKKENITENYNLNSSVNHFKFETKDIFILEEFKKHIIKNPDSPIDDRNHPIKNVINHFSKKECGNLMIADEILKLLFQADPKKAYLFTTACLDNKTSIPLGKTIVRKAFEFFLEHKETRYASAFAACCLDIGSEESKEIVIAILTLLFSKKQNSDAYAIAKLSLEKDNPICNEIAKEICEILWENDSSLALKFAKECLEIGSEKGLKLFKKICELVDPKFLELVKDCENKESIIEKFKSINNELIEDLEKEVPEFDIESEDVIYFIKEMISDSSEFFRFAKSCLRNEKISFQRIVKNAYEILLNEKEKILAFQFAIECFEKGGEVGKGFFEEAIDLTFEKQPELFDELIKFIYQKENNKELLNAIELNSEVYLENLFEKDQKKTFLFLKDFFTSEHKCNQKVAKNVMVSFLKSSKNNVAFLKKCKEEKDQKIDNLVIVAFKKYASSGHDEVDKLIKNSLEVKELKEYSKGFQEYVLDLVKDIEENLKNKSEKILKKTNKYLKGKNKGFFKIIAGLSFKNLLKDKDQYLTILNSCIGVNKKNINLLFTNILKEMILNNELEQETLNEFKKTCSSKEDELSKEIMKILAEEVKGDSNILMASTEDVIKNNNLDKKNSLSLLIAENK